MGREPVGYPTHTAVVSCCGVKPMNHASVLLDVVPVLPADSWPKRASVRVPLSTTCSRPYGTTSDCGRVSTAWGACCWGVMSCPALFLTLMMVWGLLNVP